MFIDLKFLINISRTTAWIWTGIVAIDGVGQQFCWTQMGHQPRAGQASGHQCTSNGNGFKLLAGNEVERHQKSGH